MDKHFKAVIKQHWEDPNHPRDREQWVKIDWKKVTSNIFSELVTLILFDDDQVQVLGHSLPEIIEEYIGCALGVAFTPINVLTFGILHRLKLLPETKRLNKIYKAIEECCMSQYKKRLENGPKNGGVNMLDLMIKQNQSSENKWTKEDIVGSFIFLQFAGADTSKEVSTFFLNYLGSHPEHQDKILEVVEKDIFCDNVVNFDSMDKNEYFNMNVNEALRMYSPFTNINPRKLVKTIKLGKYIFKKGTNIVIPVGNMMTQEAWHKDGLKFDYERFNTENRRKMNKMTHIPFSSGKRRCIG